MTLGFIGASARLPSWLRTVPVEVVEPRDEKRGCYEIGLGVIFFMTAYFFST